MVNWVSYKGAKCDRRDADEAYMGSFDTDSFNQGWTISGDNSGKKIELPWVVPSEYGDKITIVNTLPRLLETKLQSDLLLGKENILNPSHVRMLCYVMKLMEKKGKQYQLLFVKPLGYEDQYRQVIKEITDAHDVNIQYTEGQYIVAFYDKEESQIEEYENVIIKACPASEIKRLS